MNKNNKKPLRGTLGKFENNSLSQEESIKRGLGELKFDTPKKGKLRIMPISDSPWAPTGFGTNTRNVASVLTTEGLSLIHI